MDQIITREELSRKEAETEVVETLAYNPAANECVDNPHVLARTSKKVLNDKSVIVADQPF